jgi:hypothetical protein
MTDSHNREPIADWLPRSMRVVPGDEVGGPRLLDLLLAGIDEQSARLSADVDSLWDDLFIESCADWAVPYIGALVGLPPDAERAEVAYAVALRRRKGTPAALEDFAEIVTGLTARVIEGWQVTTWAQRLQHPPPLRVSSFSLVDDSRARVGTPFDRARRSFTPSGPNDPRAVTAIVWPWRLGTFQDVEGAEMLDRPRRFALHPLRLDAPMYLRSGASRSTSDRANGTLRERTRTEVDAPVRATYRVLQALASPAQLTYGTNWTLSTDHPVASPSGSPSLVELTLNGSLIPWQSIRFGSLPTGQPATLAPGPAEALVDISRGHVELGAALTGTLRATWHRPIVAGVGPLACTADVNHAARVVIEVRPTAVPGPLVASSMDEAITKAEAQANLRKLDPADSLPGIPDVEIRLMTSDRLLSPSQDFTPRLPNWRIVAPRSTSPVLIGDIELNLKGACLALEGFYAWGDLAIGKDLDGVSLDFITMNPSKGATLRIDPQAWETSVSIRRSILGPIRADLAARPISIRDSIVDGKGVAMRSCDPPIGVIAQAAVSAALRLSPALIATGVTFVGPVRAEAIDASDCLFADGVEVVQQQEGCLRHCYLGPELSSPPPYPPRYRCGPYPPPTFASIGFEAAGYYALDLPATHPLLGAAADGGEIGAYNHLRTGARIGRLRRRLHEFVPLGLRADVSLTPWEE